MKSALIIGAGFAGLSSALLLLREGWSVTLLEKNDQPGGRAREWSQDGFRFDMGPSWYLMPEVFERFFASVGTSVDKSYPLTRLKTQYRAFFEGRESVRITDDLQQTKALFETFEQGGARRLEQFLQNAKLKYDAALGEFLYRDYRSAFDFLSPSLLIRGWGLGLLQSLDRFVRRSFHDVRSRQLLEYAMVFLGTSPADAPALYSLLTHVDLSLGVSFPQGGMNGVARAMADLVTARGAVVRYGCEVTGLNVADGAVVSAQTAQGAFAADVVLNCADYAWSETTLLEPRWQTYKKRYWNKKKLAPSMFLVYLGLNRRLEGLEHHNLYFSENWDAHFDTIFKKPSWPRNPCFYLSVITKTDPAMAPPGCENLFLLVPIAPGLEDGDQIRQDYLEHVLEHAGRVTGHDLKTGVLVQRVYGPRDFAADYNAWNGTALGLAHTLFQTALFRPGHRSKKVRNLWYSGQYTHPGVGVPMTLISSELVVRGIVRQHGH